MVLSGSCSAMTQQQVSTYCQQAAHFALDVGRCLEVNSGYINDIADWVMAHSCEALAPLVYATQPSDIIREIQQQYGEQQASLAVEAAFAGLANELLARGVNTFIVAGGETSGTVVKQLGVNMLEIGQSIAPGVPWVRDPQRGLMLALKSGNFGNEHFLWQHRSIQSEQPPVFRAATIFGAATSVKTVTTCQTSTLFGATSA